MEDKPRCKRCQLFDPKSKLCGVLIMPPVQYAEQLGIKPGQKINLPVGPEDVCFFEQEFKAIDMDKRTMEKFKVEVQQVKIWVENPKTGERCKRGVVKMEYPVGFFGEEPEPEQSEENLI